MTKKTEAKQTFPKELYVLRPDCIDPDDYDAYQGYSDPTIVVINEPDGTEVAIYNLSKVTRIKLPRPELI